VNLNDGGPAYVIGVALILLILLIGTVTGRFIFKRIAIFFACCAAAAILLFDYQGFGS
jgi:hypothetical protein